MGSGARAPLAPDPAAPTGRFAAPTQTIDAAPYHGKRVRLSAFLKTENAESAGLWLRVDGPDAVSAFDNMHDRAIQGTTPWTRYEVVLDVGSDALDLAFGLLLSRSGKAWIDDVKIETVSTAVPTTGHPPRADATNLDFEK